MDDNSTDKEGKGKGIFRKIIIVAIIFFLGVDASIILYKFFGPTDNPISGFANYFIQNEGIIYEEDDNIDTSNFPSRFDLREQGIVTPVKSQNPWGSCWGFAAISAAETSILNDKGLKYSEMPIDLSEHQLVWFSKSHVDDENSSQNGEGVYTNGDANPLSYGGAVYTATSVFSSGIGVTSEEYIPYRGKNEEVAESRFNYSINDDWSLDNDYRYVQDYELTESSILPSPCLRDVDGNYIGYNQHGTDSIKKELLEGRAVSILYSSDQYMPGLEIGTPKYINTKDNYWTHYTFDDSPFNHAVTIVGYDDSIKKETFLDHTEDLGQPFFPEGDGAWIAKNSWGAETESFPNRGIWGIENEYGESTGYFYISYYDHSLAEPETFKFSMVEYDNDSYVINQYDFLQSSDTECWYTTDEVKMANTYIANSDQLLRSISCETSIENTKVKVEVYLINDGVISTKKENLLYSSSANYRYAGYHKIDLEEPISFKQGDVYLIALTESIETKEGIYYSVFVDSQLTKDGKIKAMEDAGQEIADNFIYGKGIVNNNESFVYIKNIGWFDWAEVVDDFSNDEYLTYYTFDNFPIKAYCEFE